MIVSLLLAPVLLALPLDEDALARSGISERDLSKLGKDVEVAPKKAYVSLRRNKQFALIQPSTRTRVDLGLNLKGVEPEGRLEGRGPSTRCAATGSGWRRRATSTRRCWPG